MELARWIVVGTDFSDGAARALEQAVELAAGSGANLACVHAYEHAPGMPAFNDPTPVLRAQLEEAIAHAGAGARAVHAEAVLRRGPACAKLLNVAADVGADLIIVGASGQNSRVHGLFLGSVATRLAATSNRFVLIVPACNVQLPGGMANGLARGAG